MLHARSLSGCTLVAACAGCGLVGVAGVSMSFTMTTPLPLLKPLALAVIVTFCGPSAAASFTTVMGKVMPLLPAPMLTLAGTVISLLSELVSDTAIGDTACPLSVMLPNTVVWPSITDAGKVSASVSASLSVIAIVSVPLVQPCTLPVTVTICTPSMKVSSTAVSVKLALLCPAGMITLAGTRSSPVSSDSKNTRTAAPAGASRLTVPTFATAPAPSLRLAGSATVMTRVSLSCTARETCRSG